MRPQHEDNNSDPLLKTLSEIAHCEGYYYDPETGDVLRNIGPGPERCRDEDSSWQDVALDALPDERRFALLTPDVTASFPEVRTAVREMYGPDALLGHVVHRQTALQPDGTLAVRQQEGARSGDWLRRGDTRLPPFFFQAAMARQVFTPPVCTVSC